MLFLTQTVYLTISFRKVITKIVNVWVISVAKSGNGERALASIFSFSILEFVADYR